MTDKQTQILLSTPIDQETLNKALSGLAALSAALEKVKDESESAAEAGSSTRSFGERISAGANTAISKFNSLRNAVSSVARDLDDFGGRAFKALGKLGTGITLAGIGITGASARSFATDFAGIDPQANAQNRASFQVKNAFDDLGRVTSRIVTPALQTLANAIEVVAKIADQAIPKGGTNPFQDFFGEKIPEAIKTVGRLKETFEGLSALIERDLGNAFDGFITNLKVAILSVREGFAKIFNGLLETIANLAEKLGQGDLANSLRGTRDTSAFGIRQMGGKTQYQLQAEKEQIDLANRVLGRNNKAAQTGQNLADADAQLSRSVQTMKDAVRTVDDFTKKRTVVGKAEVDAFIAHNEAIAKSDADYQKNRQSSQAASDKAMERLQRDHSKALEQLEKSQNEAEHSLTNGYNRDRLKAQQTYINNEAQIEKEAQLKREQDLRRHELTLQELAAEGDVAGFITEQRRFALDTSDEKQQADLAKQDRQQAFDAENRDRDEQYQTELADLQASGQEKVDELNAQYEQQTADQKEALNEQLDQLRRAHDEQKTETDRDFARQLADLDSNLAGLNDMRNAYYQRELADLNTFMQTREGYLQNLYQTGPGVMAGGSSANYGGDVYNVQVDNTVGDVATRSMLDDYQNVTIDGIARAIESSRGRGAYAY